MKNKKIKNVVFYGSCGLLGAALGFGEYWIAWKGVSKLYDLIFKEKE